MKDFLKDMQSRVSEKLDISPNYIAGCSLVEFYGTDKVRVENHLGVIKYSPELIKLRTKEGLLAISGTDMNIDGLLSDEIFISGKISKADFFPEEKSK